MPITVLGEIKRVSVDLEIDIVEKLKVRAKQDDRSMNKYLKRILTQIAKEGCYGVEVTNRSYQEGFTTKGITAQEENIKIQIEESVEAEILSTPQITLDATVKPNKKIGKL